LSSAPYKPLATYVMWLANWKKPSNSRSTFHVQEADRHKFIDEVCAENNLVGPSRFRSMLKRLNSRNSNHFRVSVFTDLEDLAHEMGHIIVAKMDSGWDAEKTRAMNGIRKRLAAEEPGFCIEDHAQSPGCAELLIKHENDARKYLDTCSKECFYISANQKPRPNPAVVAKAIKKCREGRSPPVFDPIGQIKDAYAWEYHLRKMNSKQNRIAGIVLKLKTPTCVSLVKTELRSMLTAHGNGAKPHKSVTERHSPKYGKEEFVHAVKYQIEEPFCSFIIYETAGYFVVEFELNYH